MMKEHQVRRAIIFGIKAAVIVAFFASLIEHAAADPASATVEPHPLMFIFGHDEMDFMARLAALVLYTSSILSAGIHRAWPVPRDDQVIVKFISGVIDAMSVNGHGMRRPQPTPPEEGK